MGYDEVIYIVQQYVAGEMRYWCFHHGGESDPKIKEYISASPYTTSLEDIIETAKDMQFGSHAGIWFVDI